MFKTNSKRGLFLIENITNGNMGQSILTYAAQSASDAFNNSIPDSAEKINTSDKKIQFSREIEDVNPKKDTKVTLTRGMAQKQKAKYKSDKVYSKKEVKEALASISVLENLPADVRADLLNGFDTA